MTIPHNPAFVVDTDIVARSIEIRQAIHRAPELAFQERQTAALVAEQLRSLGLEVTEGIAGTGVVGILSRGAGPMIGFRADMDALPIHEENGVAYASRIPGVMHACGHDGHTAALLGAPRQLARSGEFSGSVAFVFQPAEENEAGAKAMLEDGLFDRFPIRSIYGMHNFPGIPLEHFCTRPGAVMASFNKFEIEVSGSGGHSSQPHCSEDALRAAAAIARDLPNRMRLALDPNFQAVVSITSLTSDGGYNVLPNRASLKGSFRTMNEQACTVLAEKMGTVVSAIAHLDGCCAETTLFMDTAYPVTSNSGPETDLAVLAASQLVGAECVDGQMTPLFASEDFAFYLSKLPGNFIGYGNGDSAPLHTSRYDFNDRATASAIGYWFQLAHLTMPAPNSNYPRNSGSAVQ
jgi:amidohydrolase